MKTFIILLVLAVASPAFGEVIRLAPGDPAPREGAFFDEPAVLKLTEDLLDARTNSAKIETLSSENAALAEQISSLKRELELRDQESRKREMAMAIAEDREKRRQDDDMRVDKALARAEAALMRYDKLVDAQAKRIDSLESRAMWMGFLGPIGLVIGLFAGMF